MTNIYNIKKYYDSLSNYTMIDGLTPDIIKIKYMWLLNAIVENAIIGQDDYGLVWYSGNWLAGEWEDGTWYSGIWYDGEWKNGRFYSYRFDNLQLMQRKVRIIEKDNPKYSQFRHGIWRRGNFYNGYFGPEDIVRDWDEKNDLEILYNSIRWESGTFYNGIFRNATWNDIDPSGKTSIFRNGIFYNSEWTNGTFSNGTFQGYEWWNGNFTGGDFTGDPKTLSGVTNWWNGTFNQTDKNVKSRFGSYPISGTTDFHQTFIYWHDGTFYNGEFHSGLNIISGITISSNNHNRTKWVKGNWYNGSWYGGTHSDGIFYNGDWIEGFWSGGTFNNGNWYNGFWLNGIINNGLFQNGLFKNVVFNSGELGYQPSINVANRNIISRSLLTTKPKLYE